MTVSIKVADKYQIAETAIAVWETEVLNNEGRLAIDLVRWWGMVQGKDDGEDSTRRAKLALMPVSEVVDRACEMADLAFVEFRKRGWTAITPTFEEADRLTADQRKQRETEEEAARVSRIADRAAARSPK